MWGARPNVQVNRRAQRVRLNLGLDAAPPMDDVESYGGERTDHCGNAAWCCGRHSRDRLHVEDDALKGLPRVYRVVR